MTSGVILDTGPLVALLDRDERHHDWAKSQLETIRPPLMTCEAVITETCYLLRAHPVAANHVMRFVHTGVIQVIFSGISASNSRRAWCGSAPMLSSMNAM